MEGVNNKGTSTDPPMTLIDRQMQVIVTSIQDLARETTRQNQELWQVIRKEPPTPPQPFNDNQPPPQRENRREDQEADCRQMNHRDHEEDDAQKTPPSGRHQEESAGSATHPSRLGPAKTAQSSRRLDHSARSSRGPNDKTARLEEEVHKMKK